MRLIVILIILAHQGLYAQEALSESRIGMKLGVSHSYLITSYMYESIETSSEQSLPSYGPMIQLEYSISDKSRLVSSLRGEYVRRTVGGSNESFLPDSGILRNNRQYSLTISGLSVDGYIGASRRILSDNNHLNVGLGLFQNISTSIDETVQGTDYYIAVLNSDEFRELDTPFMLDRERRDIEVDKKSNVYLSVSFERNVWDTLSILIKYDKFLVADSSNLQNRYRIGISVLINI